MGDKTKIEWTDATWNPVVGCSRVSEGCRNCYAEAIAGRFGNGKPTVYSGLTQIVNGRSVWTGEIKETRQLLQPLSWRKPKRVFVNSMSDLFHENMTDELRDKIFAVMALCPRHTFQVLTKRPQLMLSYLEDRSKSLRYWEKEAREIGYTFKFDGLDGGEHSICPFPLRNVWLGVSVENQATADERLPLLAKTPARVRFVSYEPALGPVDLTRWINREAIRKAGGSWTSEQVDWVICGGESGPHARAMNPDWARSIRDQCAQSGTPFFFKQWGEYLPGMGPDPHKEIPIHASDTGLMHRVGKKAAGHVLDGKIYQEFPHPAAQ